MRLVEEARNFHLHPIALQLSVALSITDGKTLGGGL